MTGTRRVGNFQVFYRCHEAFYRAGLKLRHAQPEVSAQICRTHTNGTDVGARMSSRPWRKQSGGCSGFVRTLDRSSCFKVGDFLVAYPRKYPCPCASGHHRRCLAVSTLRRGSPIGLPPELNSRSGAMAVTTPRLDVRAISRELAGNPGLRPDGQRSDASSDQDPRIDTHVVDWAPIWRAGDGAPSDEAAIGRIDRATFETAHGLFPHSPEGASIGASSPSEGLL